MITRLLALVALLCLLSFVSADGCSAQPSWNKTLTPTATTFKFQNDLKYDVKVVFVSSSSKDVQASISVCTDDKTQRDALKFDLTTTGTAVTLSASSTYNENPGNTIPANSATRNVASVSTLLAIAFGLMVVFRPKNQLSVVVLMAIGLVLYAHAASTVTLTVTISIPDSITTICNGAVCGTRDAGAVSGYVTVDGDRYSTLDVVYSGKCDATTPMQVPTNWRLATATDSALAAIAFNDWKADVVVADGTVYANRRYNQKSGSAGLKTLANQFGAGVDGYQVVNCPSKILIVQHFPISAPTTNLVSSIAITTYETLNGFDYAVADNTDYDYNVSGSQPAVMITTASGWEIAPEEDSSLVFIKDATATIFGASCIVLKSGNGFTPALASCGANLLVSASRTDGTICGVYSGNSRVLIRRASTNANTLPASMSITKVHAKFGQTLAYAVLDNIDPYNIKEDGCQDRFLSAPTTGGWRFATDSELSDFITGNKPADGNVWVNTACFVSEGAHYDRDMQSCQANLVKKVVNGVTYYSPDTCGRILLVRDFTALTDYTLGMKVLFISASNEPNATIANDGAMRQLGQTTFQAMGIPYDWMPLSEAVDGTPLYSGSLPLYDSQGKPKYYAIVMTTSVPLRKESGGEAEALTKEQVAQLRYYRFLYSVRMVTLSNFNSANTQGVTMATSGTAPTGGSVTLDSSFIAANGQYLNGLVATAAFDISNQWYVGVNLPTTGTATPVLRYVATSKTAQTSSSPIVAAIISNTNPGWAYDKTEELQFYTACTYYLDHGPVLANLWVSWVTRNLWVGNRRVYFSPQIDDLYLSTEQYGNEKKTVRMTGTDMRTTKTFLDGLNAIAPAGSRLTLTYGMNCAEAGTNVTDDLVKATQELEDYFFWESHTWSHLNLNQNPEEPKDPSEIHNTTYAETYKELMWNNNYTIANIFPKKGLDTPNWSKNSMITPAITGLFNGEALRALYDAGERCVVGDNSRVELVPENPYLGMWTSKEVNGYDGIFIIPRHATEIYYNAASEPVLLLEYNERYGPQSILGKPFFDHNSTLDEVLAREGENNFRWLAAFRHDPFMFHQCNLWHFDYHYAGESGTAKKQWSLTTLWLQTVIDRYNQMLKFPLLGVKQQDLRDVYFARREREFCGLDAKLTVTGGNTASVGLTSTASCEASITGISSCGGASGCRVEPPYAGDNTLWTNMTAGVPNTLTTTGLKWNF